MRVRDFCDKNATLEQLIRDLRKNLDEARSSGLDLSEVHPPKDSQTYRYQDDLRFSCSHVLTRFINKYGGNFQHPSELLKEILELSDQAVTLFGEFKPARDYVERNMALMVQMVASENGLEAIPEEYRHLMDYKLPNGMSESIRHSR